MTDQPTPADIERTIKTLTNARAPRTICPSEAARALASEEAAWRALMPAVRSVAARLAAAGELHVTQRGKTVDANAARGPIRLSAPAPPPAAPEAKADP